MSRINGLIKRVENQHRLSEKEFQKQLDVFLNYKGNIGAPVRLGFLVAPNIKDRDLAYRFTQSLVDNVIQVILDKENLELIPGAQRDPEVDYLAFKELCGKDFNTEELGKIEKAFHSTEGMPIHMLLRAAKEINSDINRLPEVVDEFKQLRNQFNTKEADNGPYDDPDNWTGDLDESEDEEEDEGMLTKFYNKIWLKGAAVIDKDNYILATTKEMVEAARRLGKDYLIRRMKEKMMRYVGVHADIVQQMYIVVDDDRYLSNLVKVAKRSTRPVQAGKMDTISFATSNKPGILVIPKDINRLYHSLRYKMNPESDSAKVKRAPGTSVHFAVNMPNRREYIKTNLMKSSTQTVVAFPLIDNAFSKLSNGITDEQGNGVIIGDGLGKQLDELGVNNAKLNIAFLKSKGIGIYRRELTANVRGRNIEVDAVFDLQETRGFDRAMFVPGAKAMKAYLEGKDEVKIKEGDKFTPVVGVLDGIPVLLGIYETQVDVSVERTVAVKEKRMAYPQIKAFSPKAWNEMEPMIWKSFNDHKYEIERIYQLLNKFSGIYHVLESQTDKPTNRNLNKIFNKLLPNVKPTIPKGLIPARDIAIKGVRWQDSDLDEDQIKQILSAVDKYITLRKTIKLRPVKYLIRYEGRTMISPELRELMHVLARDVQSNGRYTWSNLYRYFLFVLKNFRNTIQPKTKVVGGKHATGANKRGVILPWKPEIVRHLLKQATKLSNKTIDALIDKGIDAVNLVFKALRFKVQRDPVLREIPEETVQFQKLPMDVIVVGKKTAKYINGDDDDDNVVVYTLKKQPLNRKLVEGLVEEYNEELDAE